MTSSNHTKKKGFNVLLLMIAFGIVFRLGSEWGTMTELLDAKQRPEPNHENPLTDDGVRVSKIADNSTCVFILAAPGSGSSTMVDLLGQCRNECPISGENWGAMQSIRSFQAQIVKTHHQPRNNAHAEAAWRKYFSLPEVQTATENLVRSVWNRNNHNCWGFKEIRYGLFEEPRSNFAQDVEFLSTLCAHPKIILHTRATPEKLYDTHFIRSSKPKAWQKKLKEDTFLQYQCFNSYVGLPSNATDKVGGCKPPKRKKNTPKPPRVFRHHLEDYVERNANFQQLWRYLECDSPLPNLNGTIHLSAF